MASPLSPLAGPICPAVPVPAGISPSSGDGGSLGAAGAASTGESGATVKDGGAILWVRGRVIRASKGGRGGSLALWSGALADEVKVTVGFYPAMPWERMSPTWGNYTNKSVMIHASEDDGTSQADGIQTAVNLATRPRRVLVE